MKTTFIILATLAFAFSARASDLNATLRIKRQSQTRPVPIEQPRQGEGALQWMARLGNPGQAFSPVAPPEYGDGSSFVVVDESYDPAQRHTRYGRPHGDGIKLISIPF
ncbi:MAG TPA: hypothetical protein VG733_02275 [Chthoniobacteraceae bacterium]|nr:hypothetical protein [Chthoniobacteraceae bacterium]